MNIDKMIAKFDEIYPVGRVIQYDKYREIGSLINSLRDILEAGREEEEFEKACLARLDDRLANFERRIEQKDGERLFDNEVIMAKVSRLEERMEHHFIVDGNWKEAAHLRFTKLEKKHEPVFIIEPDCTCHNDIWTCKRHPEKNKGYKPPVPPSECETKDMHCGLCGEDFNFRTGHTCKEDKLETVRTFDARTWAKSFNETLVKLGHQPHDEGWLQSWFANAIMCGYDHANKPAPSDEPSEDRCKHGVHGTDCFKCYPSDEPKLPKLPKNWGKIKTPDGRIVDFETMKEDEPELTTNNSQVTNKSEPKCKYCGK